jgi:hypothetical protein
MGHEWDIYHRAKTIWNSRVLHALTSVFSARQEAAANGAALLQPRASAALMAPQLKLKLKLEQVGTPLAVSWPW